VSFLHLNIERFSFHGAVNLCLEVPVFDEKSLPGRILHIVTGEPGPQTNPQSYILKKFVLQRGRVQTSCNWNWSERSSSSLRYLK
jgi:hypothetical protein